MTESLAMIRSQRFLYAFDVDHTLEISSGPVKLQDILTLRAEGHITGVCGNWGLVVQRMMDWHNFFSFGIPNCVSKAAMLTELKKYCPVDGYVMVGNDPLTGFGTSEDKVAAQEAGWRFILEKDFAKGER